MTQNKCPTITSIVLKLHDIGAVKFGSFALKSGIVSPVYIDLRESVSYPSLLKEIAEAMWKKIQRPFDRLCGVPYTALPIASYLSVAYDQPMVMRRKEAKEYGTKKIVEGVFESNQTCVILEDLITSGASIFETIAPLEDAGLQVKDIVVFLDREQGGRKLLEQRGYQMHSVVTITEMLEILHSHDRIDKNTKANILDFAKSHTYA